MVSSHQTRDLECFADSSNTPWNPPTILCPSLIATILQMSLLSLCALFFLQSHVLLICVAFRTTIPGKIFTGIAKFQGSVSVNDLWFPRRLQELTSLSSSGSPGKFLFYIGRVVTTELPNLVPPRRIDDCYAIHFLHWFFFAICGC